MGEVISRFIRLLLISTLLNNYFFKYNNIYLILLPKRKELRHYIDVKWRTMNLYSKIKIVSAENSITKIISLFLIKYENIKFIVLNIK